MNSKEHTTKDFMTTVMLSLILGGLGADRFYLGKYGTGILKLITFGGFGIWYLIDLVLVLSGSTRDKSGKELSARKNRVIPALIITIIFLVLFGIFIVYAIITAPPRTDLKSIKPNEITLVESSKYSFEGKAFPASSTVSVNGQPVTTSSDGNFTYEVELNEGDNRYEIKTVDEDKTTTQIYTLKRLSASEITERNKQENTDTVVERKKSEKPKAVHNPENYWHKVSKVVDGDTVKAIIDGKEQTIRVIGIDTPESTTNQECYGSEASAKAKTILQGKWIKIKSDNTQDQVDRYGRLLRYLSYGKNIDYGETIIASGYAYEYTYDQPYQNRDKYIQRQEEAKANSLGLWKSETCSGQRIKPTPAPAPKPVTNLTPTPRPVSVPAPAPTPTPSGAYYVNCTAARNAGVAPIYVGQPGYRSALDRDNDGVACE